MQYQTITTKAKQTVLSAIVAFGLASPTTAQAHFLELIPNKSNVENPEDATVSFDITFTHPFAGGACDGTGPTKALWRYDWGRSH